MVSKPPVLRSLRVMGDPSRLWQTLPTAVTLGCLLLAAALAWRAWHVWLAQPWTRDGRVRVYVVSMAPEVAGRIVALTVHDNQFVHKGDALMVIDPADYALAVRDDEALLLKVEADARDKAEEARRRLALTTLSTSIETKQNFVAISAQANDAVSQAQAQLSQARVNLRRTQMISPVNGWVTNLQAQEGDYATVGQRNISIVNADSFWLDGYFEETALASIHDGDPARIYLLSYRLVLHGHVDSLARGIQIDNAQADPQGLANVNPIFTWVRLAQRIPVRISFDAVPPRVRLVAGLTATVAIDRRPKDKH